MIYTVTFNPALDYVMFFDSIDKGKVNRSKSERLYIGGKGINVSVMLKRLGTESTALGFTAGFTGDAIEKGLTELDIANDFIKLENGLSRINVKLKSAVETDLNGTGPEITEHALALFLEKIDNLCDGDTLILSGSIPSNLSQNIYEHILSHISHKTINTVVDATGELLLSTLKHKPFLIKPNTDELRELTGFEITDTSKAIKGAKILQNMGAKNVLVSMGRNGALLVCETSEVYKIEAPSGTAVNAVGAGDSMVAGFIFEWINSKDYKKALKLGTACGSATAFSEDLATYKKITETIAITSEPVRL